MSSVGLHADTVSPRLLAQVPSMPSTQMHVLREKGIMSSLSSAFLVNMAAALQDSQW